MRNIVKTLFVIIFVMFFGIKVFYNTDTKLITAENGSIDFNGYNLQKISELNGQWEIILNELVDPNEIDEYTHVAYVNLPTELIISNSSEFLNKSDGVATLRLNINGLENNKIYGISIPYFSSSNKIWIDRKLTKETGKVSKIEEKYEAKYIPSEIFFESKNKSVELVIQIANFHHRRIRLLPIKLGTYDSLYKTVNRKLIKQSLIIGSLLLIGIYYFILYKIQRKESAMMYLAIISICVAVREMIVHERILIRLFPNLSGEWMMKLGFLPVFIILPLIVCYIQGIFKVRELDKIVKFLKWFGIVMITIILITNIKIYDLIFEYGSFLILLLAAYLIYIIVSKKLIKKTKRSEAMVIGLIAVLIGAMNDVFRELSIINTPEMLSIGIVIFILFQAVFLAWRFNDSFEMVAQLSDENASMYQELQELNTELESKIKKRTKDLECANRELSKLTIKDPLMNIGNRRYCDEKLKECWLDSQVKNISVALIMIDIDYFKNYNDLYGHIKGDWCLKLVGKILKKSIKNDKYSITRYGGEEFLIILPRANCQEAINIAKIIQNNISKQQIEHKNSKVSDRLTFSMGVGVFEDKTFENEREWVDKTDELLYQAKKYGRNQFKVQKF